MKNYILKISLDNTDLWRRIALPHGYNFSQLHDIIQIAFGWEDYHAQEFQTPDMLIIPDHEEDTDMIEQEFLFESDANLDTILQNEKNLKYAYDFGDGWELTIAVENTDAKGETFPVLTEYAGTMAREDCGGPYGLNEQGGEPVNAEEINMILEHMFGD